MSTSAQSLPPINDGKTSRSSHISKHKNFYFAITETIAFLAIATLLDAFFGTGERFLGMSLHPFWAIVLLVTVQYGPKEALAASILASLFLLVGNMPEQSVTETLYGYILRVIYLPFLWVVASLILGAIRSRQIREKELTTERLNDAQEAYNTIASSYSALKQTKEQLELRLAEERRSVLSVYNIAKSLETIDTVDAFKEAENLVKSVFNATKFSIFTWDADGLQLKVAHGWDKSSNFARRFDNDSLLARGIQKKRVISLVNAEDEAVLDKQGMLAGPILDAQTGAIYGMLKIDEIAFVDMGIRTHETFRIVCEWIGRIYANVEKYNQARRHHMPVLAQSETINITAPSLLPKQSLIAA